MALRTTRTSITSKAPFRLTTLDEILPAGGYDVDTEELERMEAQLQLSTIAAEVSEMEAFTVQDEPAA